MDLNSLADQIYVQKWRNHLILQKFFCKLLHECTFQLNHRLDELKT